LRRGVDQHGARVGRRQRRAVRSILGAGTVDIGGGEQARADVERRATGLFATVVSAAVEPLVRAAGDFSIGRQRRAAPQDAVGVVAAQMHTFPFGVAQVAGFVADAAGRGDAAEVVQEAGTADARGLVGRQALRACCCRGRRRDTLRMPGEKA
jgi:hypothetical protein